MMHEGGLRRETNRTQQATMYYKEALARNPFLWSAFAKIVDLGMGRAQLPGHCFGHQPPPPGPAVVQSLWQPATGGEGVAGSDR
jgi:hypothetical protein